MAQGGENENIEVDETLENEKIKLGNAWLQLANRISDSEKSIKKTLKVDEKQGKKRYHTSYFY